MFTRILQADAPCRLPHAVAHHRLQERLPRKVLIVLADHVTYHPALLHHTENLLAAGITHFVR